MVIRLVPEHYAALLNLGTVFEVTGKSPEAITMYQRSIAIHPTYMGYSNLGTAYSRAKRYTDADAFKPKKSKIDIPSPGDHTLTIGGDKKATTYKWKCPKRPELATRTGRIDP